MPPRALPTTLALAVLVGSLGVASCHAAGPAPGVVARVNGQPVTAIELDHLYAAQTAGTPSPSSSADAVASPLPADQRLQLRLSLLNQIIDRHILLQYAGKLGISADPAAVARQVALDKAPDGDADRKTDEAEQRQRIADTLVLNQLIQREVVAKVHVTDDEIAAFYQQNQASFHLPERQYHVLEIVVTPRPAPVTNLAEDKAATPAAARKKIAMLRQRLLDKADFGVLAQQYSEDPATASSGGDLGLIPQSVLMKQTPPALRDAILALRPGQISPVITTPTGLYLVKLEGVEPAGLRPVSDPQVKQSIHDLLANSRQQLLQAAFLTTARDQAKVENYLAADVLAGRNPSPQP